jgi:hypothetical protein
MPDNDFNLIKPVDALGNITGLSPLKRREQRKHKKNQYQNNQSSEPKIPEESVEQELNEADTKNENGNEQNSGGIDYRA